MPTRDDRLLASLAAALFVFLAARRLGVPAWEAWKAGDAADLAMLAGVATWCAIGALR